MHGKKQSWSFWIATALLLLPVLYVASSGPARMIAVRRYFVVVPTSAPPAAAPGSPMGIDAEFVEEVAPWWLAGYAPLAWAADQGWIEPVVWYWDLFPTL